MPEFKPRAIALESDFNELSAAALHIAHCAVKSMLEAITKSIIDKTIFLLIINVVVFLLN